MHSLVLLQDQWPELQVNITESAFAEPLEGTDAATGSMYMFYTVTKHVLHMLYMKRLPGVS